jgi:hypothetical protein
MARLQLPVDNKMEAREFFYYADSVQRDIIEEEKERRVREAAAARNRGRRG